ncbi:hypothetical protein D3C86_1309240 [compost metagenome]
MTYAHIAAHLLIVVEIFRFKQTVFIADQSISLYIIRIELYLNLHIFSHRK